MASSEERTSKLIRVRDDFVKFMEHRHQNERAPPIRYQVEDLFKNNPDFMRAFKRYQKQKGGD